MIPPQPPTSRSLAASCLLSTVYCLLLSACAPQSLPQPPKGYFGPTEPMAKVIADINANNQRIPTLWSRIYYEITIVDPDTQKTTFVNGEGGSLQFRKPRDFRLRATKTGLGLVFDIGSNADRFWLAAPEPGPNTLWWGHYRNLNKPCAQSIPIRPDLLLEVLGIGNIDTNFLAQPIPVMRFNNDADAYMFLWNTQSQNHWIVQKEVWYDRQTKQPRLVLLFDPNGRIILRAYPSDFRPVEIDNTPRQNQPLIASRYDLLFPETKSKMLLQLHDPALRHQAAPSDASFRFTGKTSEDMKEIQIDENCDR